MQVRWSAEYACRTVAHWELGSSTFRLRTWLYRDTISFRLWQGYFLSQFFPSQSQRHIIRDEGKIWLLCSLHLLPSHQWTIPHMQWQTVLKSTGGLVVVIVGQYHYTSHFYIPTWNSYVWGAVRHPDKVYCWYRWQQKKSPIKWVQFAASWPCFSCTKLQLKGGQIPHQDPSWISWGTFILDQIQKGVIIKLDFMDIPMQQSSTEAENCFQQWESSKRLLPKCRHQSKQCSRHHQPQQWLLW